MKRGGEKPTERKGKSRKSRKRKGDEKKAGERKEEAITKKWKGEE